MKKIVTTLAAVLLGLGTPAVAVAMAPAEDCGGYGSSCEKGYGDKGYGDKGYGEEKGYGGHEGGYGHDHEGDSGNHPGDYPGHGGSGAHAQGIAVGSPGVLSGNVVQVPIHVPINACGNTVSVIGALNPAFGNVCVNA